MEDNFVVVKELYKSYGALNVISGLNLRVSKGEYLAIMGASGSGKTTLLQMLGLLDTPDSGEIVVNGYSLRGLSERNKNRYRNLHLGFVFQFHELLPEFTAEENVALPALIKGTPIKDALREARALLKIFSLSNRATHKPYALSGGEKQRVAVARALINKPDLLLADEPSGSLDEGHKEELHMLLDTLKKDYGQTMIIVTHDENLAFRADRVLRLENGNLSPTTLLKRGSQSV